MWHRESARARSERGETGRERERKGEKGRERHGKRGGRRTSNNAVDSVVVSGLKRGRKATRPTRIYFVRSADGYRRESGATMPSLVVLVALTRVLSCTSLRRRPDGTMLARGNLRGVSEAPRNHTSQGPASYALKDSEVRTSCGLVPKKP
jgi:hypothetical protein